ncbi:MAG: hypothetical protein N2202_01335 [Proteobacteria bacterium]|nr:hypothetical protein [Pseudomonadota bacterium]
MIRNFIWLFILLLLLSNCATVTKTGMFEYEPSKKEMKIDNTTFSLIVNKNNWNYNFTENARKYYPNIFYDDFSSLPVFLNLNCDSDIRQSDPAYSLISAFSLMTIPVPMMEKYNICRGSLKIATLPKKEIYYKFERTEYFPGLWFFLAPLFHSREEFEPNEEQTIVEYAVKAINEEDSKKLKDMYEYRKARIHKISLYGEPYWVFVALTQSEKASKEGKNVYDLALAQFWKEYPKILSNPLESIVIAIKEEEGWKPIVSTPKKLGLKKLTAVSAKILNDRPIAIDVREDVLPRVEYFIYLSNYNDSEEIRWSNNMLIEAKNLSFPEDLRQKSRDELTKLLIDFEKEMIKINEILNRLELSLQQKLVNKQDTTNENTLIPIYQQRLNIFEALITSLKQSSKLR